MRAFRLCAAVALCAAISVLASTVSVATPSRGSNAPPVVSAPAAALPGTASEIEWATAIAEPRAPAEAAGASSGPCSGQIFPGDGAGLGPALSYTDNGDGTVTDNNTGFMWEKKVTTGSPGCLSNPHHMDSTCTWSDATGAWINALNAGTGYAGHTDWRLPNVKELQSTVDYSDLLIL